jgi:hypothetical protein
MTDGALLLVALQETADIALHIAREVDFVVWAARAVTAIEVKSGRGRQTHPGLETVSRWPAH